MAEAVRNGSTVGTVASQFGVSVNCVMNACRENRVQFLRRPQKNPRTPAPKTWLVAKDLLCTDLSQCEIASKHKLSQQRVNHIARIMARCGFSIPTKKDCVQ